MALSFPITLNRKKTCYQVLTYAIAPVWLLNGLYCKLLNQVPRHRLIVARILGPEHATGITLLIGFAETMMALWIISRIAHRFNAILQMMLIAVMNTLEFILAPDLLLWGRGNAIFAALLILLIGYQEFILYPKTLQA